MTESQICARLRCLAIAGLSLLVAGGAVADPAFWEKDIAAFEAADRAAPPPKGAILFAGSSSIRMWTSLAQDFPGHRVINRGFGGAKVEDVIAFADRIVVPHEPRQVVLYIGTNDIADGQPAGEVLAEMKTLLEKLRARLPAAQIDVISLATNPARWAQVRAVEAVNAGLAAWTAAQPRMRFIDVFHPMLNAAGEPRPEIYGGDQLHMNAAGYALWREIVRPYLTPEPVAPMAAKRIPVVLDTDIGTDIDDTWALAHLLRSPELDLKLVLTDTGDARYRAAIVAKLLEAAGRTDVAVGLGKDFGPMPEESRNQEPWIRGYDLAKYPGRVHEDGVGALIELVMKSPEPVTVIAVGPVPTLAAALAREPGIAARCRFVGMHGSFAVGYGGGAPAAEWNVRADVPALRTVLAAPWQDILLTPLDTCDRAKLDGTNYAAVWSAAPSDPLVRAVIENYCIFAPRVRWMNCDWFATRSTTLFDCVAVYLAYAEDLVEAETVRFRITDDGFTVCDDAGGPLRARVALRWRSLAAFEQHLTARLVPGTR